VMQCPERFRYNQLRGCAKSASDNQALIE